MSHVMLVAQTRRKISSRLKQSRDDNDGHRLAYRESRERSMWKCSRNRGASVYCDVSPSRIRCTRLEHRRQLQQLSPHPRRGEEAFVPRGLCSLLVVLLEDFTSIGILQAHVRIYCVEYHIA